MRMTCGAIPSQWEGTLDDGRRFHAHYRSGVLSVGLGADVNGAIDNGQSDDALFCHEVGDFLDGCMSYDELRAHLAGLLAFPDDLEVEGERRRGR